jgi:hypothetical protein
MLNKKILTCLLLLIIVSICAISTVSATEDVAGTVEASDTVTIEETAEDDVATNFEEDLEKTVDETNVEEVVEGEKLSASEEDSKLTVDESDEVLSMIFASWYEIDLFDTTISSDKKEQFKCYIEPCQISSYPGYDFNFIVYDKNAKAVYTHHYQSTSTDKRNYTITIAKNTLTPGEYYMVAENTYDGVIMDIAKLYVKGTAVITASNYNAAYMSGAKMTATLTDMVTQKPLSSLSVKVIFTKGKTSIIKYYTPNSNGQISFEPPVGVGTWTVTITPGPSYISGSAVKTATINKGAVSVAIKKIVEYKGFKVTLKATVKSSGKKVNEGKVKFKINGKKYVVAVKNGVATKKIKLNKVKKYPYAAKFIKGTNLKDSKKVKNKVVMKKRIATKIVAKDQKVNTVQAKYFHVKVLTKSGKKVNGGTIKIVGKKDTPQPVKKGKAKLVKYGAVSMLFKGTNGYIYKYKKSITKKYKLKYKTGSHKYKSSSVKVKLTVTYKCPLCGKKSTHYHYHTGYYRGYYTKIVVY